MSFTNNMDNRNVFEMEYSNVVLPPINTLNNSNNSKDKPAKSFLRSSQPAGIQTSSPLATNTETNKTTEHFPPPSTTTLSQRQEVPQITQTVKFMTPQQQQIDKEQLSSQFINYNQYYSDKLAVVFSELDQMEDICMKEQLLIGEYRQFLKNADTNSAEVATKVQQFQNDIKALIQKKSRALTYILEGHGITGLSDNFLPPKPKDNSNQFCLTIVQQPAEAAVANRYLYPAPQLAISPKIIPAGSTFVVCVSLSYHGNVVELGNTLDGKQEVLQGVKRVKVDESFMVVFSKLKVMEVSSKHRHQPFCLIFTLEEYSNEGDKTVRASVKTAPFQVQSRPNKRKSTGSLPSAKRVFSPSLQKQIFARKVTSSLPNFPTIQNEKERAEGLSSSTGGLPPPEVPSSGSTLMEEDTNDSCYIDITDLLSLPQKDAAKKLGISESMLCKRFKECTRRKWPYRNLRKIDKLVRMLQIQKQDSSIVQPEDQEKLEKLMKDREECLKPVKIRITTHDKLLVSSSKNDSENDAIEYEFDHENSENNGEYENENEEITEDISCGVAETLETLKNSKESVKPSNSIAPPTENNELPPPVPLPQISMC